MNTPGILAILEQSVEDGYMNEGTKNSLYSIFTKLDRDLDGLKEDSKSHAGDPDGAIMEPFYLTGLILDGRPWGDSGQLVYCKVTSRDGYTVTRALTLDETKGVRDYLTEAIDLSKGGKND